MDIYDVQVALAAACSAVVDSSGAVLTCYEYVPNSINEPAFYVGEYTIDPNGTFGGRYMVTFTCRVLVSSIAHRQDQKRLAKLLSQSGASSVYAALMAARGAPGSLALGGAADDFSVQSLGKPSLYTIGDKSYYGAEISIEVVGS